MTPEEVDRQIAEASDPARHAWDGYPAAVSRAKKAILDDLRPVRPLPSDWALALGFLSLFAIFAGSGALALGMYGIHVLSGGQSALIFTILAGSAALAAIACVREMRPASGSPLGAVALAGAVILFPLIFAAVFHGYGTRDLVKQGIPCLIAGLCVSVPAGLVTGWIIRRGFVLSWSRAGGAAGTLCGLAGLGMLELHCPNLIAIHVILWHVAVVLLSGLLGFLMGRALDAVRPS